MLKLILIIFTILIASTNLLYSQNVQWASRVIGYSSEFSQHQFSAEQALGKPSVMSDFGISPAAWMPLSQVGHDEWIHVGFDKPINVRQIVVAENYNPGTITKIFLFDSLNNSYLVYEQEALKDTSESGNVLNIFIDKTKYKVYSVMLQLDTRNVEKCQIDAIGISDSKIPYKISINTISSKVHVQKPENLGPNINSEFHELGPVITVDGKTLYFTRGGHPENIGDAKKQDVWYSTLGNDGKFTKSINIGPPINNEFNNFAFSVSSDGNALLLGNVYHKDGSMSKGLSISYYKNGVWSFPEEIKIKNFYNKYYATTYFMGSNGKVLLMSIERDDSYGELDLYVSFLESDGTWSEPKNLGTDVNTAAGEVSPFLAADGITLYYATEGLPGYGNRDMFMTRRLDESWTKWEEPINLGSGLNTPGGDSYFNIPASGEYAYFISNENSYGEEDIFRVILPEELKPRPVAIISGRVINQRTGQPMDAKILYETMPEGVEAGFAHSNSVNGEFRIVLPVGKKYGFLAQADSFLSVSENIDLTKINKYIELKKDLYLVPIEDGQSFSMNNIFFDFNKWELLPGSEFELNRVVQFLNDNPGFNIEIKGHTDSVGSSEINKALSLRRAQAVEEYLIKHGIVNKRLIVVAAGKEQPAVPNDTEENRQKNRRVEFVIIKNDLEKHTR